MAKYGIPYLGSKGGIAEAICKIFPKAKNFYDLFGGGFSITHCMLTRRPKDFEKFHFNEPREGIIDLIKDAIAGKYNYDNFKPEFIDRETFLKKKDSDPYIKMCWSFSNKGNSYRFGKEIESYKKSMHNAIVFNKFDQTAKEVFGMESFPEGYTIQQKRFFLRNKIVWHNNNREKKMKRGDLQQLERLQELERLQQLEQLEQLEFYKLDYKAVPILENSIIYCDPPYAPTKGYDRAKSFYGKDDFDYYGFLDWAHEQKHPVFISEYSITDKRFVPIFTIGKIRKVSVSSRKLVQEKVYANHAALDIIRNPRHN